MHIKTFVTRRLKENVENRFSGLVCATVHYDRPWRIWRNKLINTSLPVQRHYTIKCVTWRRYGGPKHNEF